MTDSEALLLQEDDVNRPQLEASSTPPGAVPLSFVHLHAAPVREAHRVTSLAGSESFGRHRCLFVVPAVRQLHKSHSVDQEVG